MSRVLEVRNAEKSFRKEQVLCQVSLSLEEGEIGGIIGRNGCGKTVLFKCICGFMKLDAGEIYVRERQIGKDIQMPDNTGVIIEHPGFLNWYSGFRNLKLLSKLRGSIKDPEIWDALKKVGLEEAGKKKVGKYSMGMKQRLGIAQAIMEKQDFLILDEPMNGLDNTGVKEMRALFKSLGDEGTTILLTSHNHEDIAQLCDRVFEMDHGVMHESAFHTTNG